MAFKKKSYDEINRIRRRSNCARKNFFVNEFFVLRTTPIKLGPKPRVSPMLNFSVSAQVYWVTGSTPSFCVHTNEITKIERRRDEAIKGSNYANTKLPCGEMRRSALLKNAYEK